MRKYHELIRYSQDLTDEEKDQLNDTYTRAFDYVNLNYSAKPLLLRQMAIYIVRNRWKTLGLNGVYFIIDEWFEFYDKEFVEYQQSFVQTCDDFDLHKSFALKFCIQYEK